MVGENTRKEKGDAQSVARDFDTFVAFRAL